MTFPRIAAVLLLAGACTKAEAPAPSPGSAPSAPAEPTPPPVSATVAPSEQAAAALAPPQRGDDAERKSKNGRLEAEVAGVPVVVQYGRPAMRGRAVFGGIVPYGEVWRTGADEATTLTFRAPVTFGGRPVAPGTYALFTIPGPDKWTVILNEPPQQWGAYKYDEAKDLARAEVTPEKTDAPVEELTFAAKEGTLVLSWADTQVRLPIGRP